MGHSLTFAYHGLTVRVDAPDAALMGWLREFLTPAFTVVQGVTADHIVEVLVDDAAYAEVFGRGACAGDPCIDCFALDSGMVRLPLWASRDGQRTIFDPARKVFYLVDPDGVRVRLVTASGNLAARFAVMSVVREFAMTAAQSDESVVIHGAALAGPGGGIIIAGPKGAGKTTLLIEALLERTLWFVANDRVVVDLRPLPTLHGMPTVISIRPDTLEQFPALTPRLLCSGFDHRLALGEDPPPAARLAAPRTGVPVDLSPAQLCQLLGVYMWGRSALRAFVFPRVTAETHGPHLLELPAPDAMSRLTEALFARGSASVTSRAFGPPPRHAADRTAREAVLQVLATRVRSFQYNPKARNGADMTLVEGLTHLVQGSPASRHVGVSVRAAD